MEERYERVSQVGEGTYGKVYKARCKDGSGKLVAMKKIRMEAEKEGFPVTAVREIKLLKLLKHENIISILDIVASPDGVSLVFEYFEHDLSGLLQHPSFDIGPSHIKYIMAKLLEALAYMHARRIVHRDLKTSNILIGKDGQAKLADFGLAKSTLQPDEPESDRPTRLMTNRVVTLWYRPPEILLGSTQYGPEADMWGVGCVLVELFTKKALFAANSELEQIETILKHYRQYDHVIDYPWSHLLDFKALKKEETLTEMLKDKLPADALDLALSLLQLDSEKRITAAEALKHPFFSSKPSPFSALPIVYGEWHEFECKQRRKESKTKE